MCCNVLPLLPLLNDDALDAIIIGVVMLPPEAQQHAVEVLRNLHGIFDRHLALSD
jgi:hypothetical protein